MYHLADAEPLVLYLHTGLNLIEIVSNEIRRGFMNILWCFDYGNRNLAESLLKRRCIHLPMRELFVNNTGIYLLNKPARI